eukprot:CAMPEP_0117614832 /NCGR_PEP_ID=MMETSP0784-20121206/84237_1 /TAXON_ID=39447 /ORGANISM="" /LENGTH=106 /DNA_ID=CAMNT_0005418569 /DNA_START=126 /DNA_END=443 /DNA_ORIENTATION=+
MHSRHKHGLSKGLTKQLYNLDMAYKVIRHLTPELISQVLTQLRHELVTGGDGPLVAHGSRTPSTSGPSQMATTHVDEFFIGDTGCEVATQTDICLSNSRIVDDPAD